MDDTPDQTPFDLLMRLERYAPRTISSMEEANEVASGLWIVTGLIANATLTDGERTELGRLVLEQAAFISRRIGDLSNDPNLEIRQEALASLTFAIERFATHPAALDVGLAVVRQRLATFPSPRPLEWQAVHLGATTALVHTLRHHAHLSDEQRNELGDWILERVGGILERALLEPPATHQEFPLGTLHSLYISAEHFHDRPAAPALADRIIRRQLQDISSLQSIAQQANHFNVLSSAVRFAELPDAIRAPLVAFTQQRAGLLIERIGNRDLPYTLEDRYAAVSTVRAALDRSLPSDLATQRLSNRAAGVAATVTFALAREASLSPAQTSPTHKVLTISSR